MRADFKYYSLKEILKRNAQYNLIIGERSNGKTYAVEKLILENFFRTGKHGAIIRRWREDFRNKRGYAMFAPFVADGTIEKLSGGRFNDILYRNNTWYLVSRKEVEIKENTPFCFSFSLSDMEHDKSTSYPLVTTILFDEFLTRSYYLNDEFVIFCNCLSTIIRDRDNVRIFMCGNTVNKYAPYFSEMGLTHVKNMRQGDIDVYNYGNGGLKIAVEYCATTNTRNRKKSDIYFAFDNPHLEMVRSGKWELDSYPHLPEKYAPRDIKFTYFISFDSELLQCEVIMKGRNTFTFIHRKTTDIKNPDRDLIYDTEQKSGLNNAVNILRPVNRLQERIAWYYKSGKVFYQDNEVGNIVNNYLNYCRTA